MRWRRALKLAIAGIVVPGLVWLGGFAWFVHGSLTVTTDRAAATDAIVVLTGGQLRVQTALDLLSAGRAQKLFISGVNPHVDRVELLRVAGRTDDNAGRIEIGHDAENTQGNARETAEWMQHQGYRSLRLVTSWYHMQRSLLEFERAMPGTRIVAEPVYAAHSEPETWSDWVDVALLVAGEYNKYLATLVRPQIAVLLPHAALSGRSASVTTNAAAYMSERRQ